jgi:anti-anti-sigma factor
VIEAAPFRVRTELRAERARLHVSGDLDSGTLAGLARAVEGVRAGGAGRVEIDLSGLTCVDPSALRLFLELHEAAQDEGWTLSLVRPERAVFEIFELAGGAEVLPFHDATARITRSQRDGHPAAELELSLERGFEAPGTARAALATLCDEHAIERSTRHTVLLLASEVVSNAVLHSNAPSGATISLSASVASGAIRVCVTDAGGGFEPTERDPERIDGGYGLYLLEQAATRWGVECNGTSAVWFELEIPS